MYLPDSADDQLVESVEQLVETFRAAGKPREQWRIGTETEMIGVYRRGDRMGCAPSHGGPRGIGVLLEEIGKLGWRPVREDVHIIALACRDAQITIEPGGQLELAARPVDRQAVFEDDLLNYQAAIASKSADLDIAWLALGFRPWGTIDEVPWMPKRRYVVMRNYLPTRGRLAHEMMKRTATTQVNVDFGDAVDAGEKLRCIMGVTPILTSLFASSPIVDGKPSGYQSYRAHVWLHTDPDRCGLLPFAFEDGDVFRNYAEWALDVPLFFVYRDDRYIPAGEVTFRQFMHDGFQGHRPNMGDWGLHLSTLFPDARLKRFMEVRGCDAGSRALITALGPLCKGILYDDLARGEAIALTEGLTFAERVELQEQVARYALTAPVATTGHTIGDLARELLAIAADGLGRVAPDEEPYLDPLREIAHTGRTRSDAILDIWQASAGDPARVIPALAHPGLGDGQPPPPPPMQECGEETA